MNQRDISHDTLARLYAERDTATDPNLRAGIEAQIRLHAELAGEPVDAEPVETAPPVKAARTAKASG